VSVRARSAGASDGSIVRRRIGINGNLISSDPSFRSAGIATYIRRLAERLPVVDPDTDYVLFGQLATGLMVRSWGWTRRREGRIIWEQVLSPIQVRTARLGLLHSPANVAPVALGLPSVVTVHDLTFIRQPEWFHGRDRFILAPLMRLSIQRADAVIVPSASTGRDVAEHYSLPEDRIEVIPEGVDPRFSETTPVSAPVPYPYILHVGTIEPRKNLPVLIEAAARLRALAFPHRLVLVGGRGWKYEAVLTAIRNHGLEDWVVEAGFQSDLLPWYRYAAAFVYPSAYEGFGLPPLEAMACGVPTVVSSGGSLPEVVGDGAVVVPVGDVSRLVQALEMVLRDSPSTADLKRRATEKARSYSWDACAERTAQVFHAVLDSRARMGTG